MFLHEVFFDQESNAVKTFLLFKRLAFKAQIVRKNAEQNQNLAEKLKDSEDIKADLLPVCEVIAAELLILQIRERLVHFTELSNQFVSYMANCSAENFIKFGGLYEDLYTTEKKYFNIVIISRINTFLDLLKNESFQEAECLPELERHNYYRS